MGRDLDSFDRCCLSCRVQAEREKELAGCLKQRSPNFRCTIFLSSCLPSTPNCHEARFSVAFYSVCIMTLRCLTKSEFVLLLFPSLRSRHRMNVTLAECSLRYGKTRSVSPRPPRFSLSTGKYAIVLVITAEGSRTSTEVGSSNKCGSQHRSEEQASRGWGRGYVEFFICVQFPEPFSLPPRR